jgi:hypothetical protein
MATWSGHHPPRHKIGYLGLVVAQLSQQLGAVLAPGWRL